MMPLFRMLARMAACAARAFDIFGYSADRKLERELIAGYEKDVATVLGLLSPVTLDTAIELLSLPDRIRGYGPVKEKAVAGSQGAPRATGRRPRQPAARAAADRGGVGPHCRPGEGREVDSHSKCNSLGKGLGRGLEVKAFARGVVVDGDEPAEAAS